jgi:phospholipid-transporting ATPase
MNIERGGGDRERLVRPQQRSIFADMFGGTDENDLPSGLPAGWPRSTEADFAALPNRIINLGDEQSYSFKDNFVKTSKYTVANFVPKFLLEEFDPKTKIANVYFLGISLLQCVRPISNTGGVPTTMLPLSIVVLVDAIFQIREDMSRHKADKVANSTLATRFVSRSKQWVSTEWHLLQVGDYVKVHSREQFPCDLLIVAVAEKEGQPARGQCFVETKQLDGETNLKLRVAMPNTFDKINDESKLAGMKGQIKMEHPNNVIDNFEGRVDMGQLGVEVAQPMNIALRGCVLRNTEWIIGIAVNTGHDTKIMMSARETEPKTSVLDKVVSLQIGRIILLLVFFCFMGAIGNAAWNQENEAGSIWYLGGTLQLNPGLTFFQMFFYYFLLHATFIPVSLYVSMTMSRAFQSYFMNNDMDMYYPRIDTPAKVRTMQLNEELGQISHIFSDKTGTLTCNIMDFRKCSVNGIVYGQGITEIGKASWALQGKPIPDYVLEAEELAKQRSQPHVTFYDPGYDKLMKDPASAKERLNVGRFFRLLAITHDVIAERVDDKIKLSASNPDDEALVCAATYFGFNFADRRDKFIIMENKETGKTEEIELLETIEFSSKRKRMSVVVRDIDGKIRLFSKGADTVMLERLKGGQDDLITTTNAQVEQFSEEGLRCLLVGSVEIEDDWYNKWRAKYHEAKTNLAELEKKKKLQPNAIESLEDEIEANIDLIGATALEDRLQDGVPEAIALMAKAGIKIWVLTGDKEGTAINIAVACNLVQPKEYMEQIIINKSTAPTRAAMIKVLEQQYHRITADVIKYGNKSKPRALIIDGPSLNMLHPPTTAESGALRAQTEEECAVLKDRLLKMGTQCKAVVGCRVSPDQKREIVELIKLGVPGVRTLSIGDGANDVAMIQEAHIGVGIRGEEGLQAVNASDYAIAQFRYVASLILKHGRWNYIRMSQLVCYMFYKNVFMSLGQWWFNFNNGWSGQKYYTEAAIQMFNLMYTSIPIIVLSVYDRDITATSCFNFPEDYKACIRSEHFTTMKFWGWLVTGIFESIWCSVLPLYLLYHSDRGIGVEASFWNAGSLCFSCVVIICNAKLFFIQNRWHWVMIGLVFASVLVWWLSALFFAGSLQLVKYSSTAFWEYYDTFYVLNADPSFWAALFLISLSVIAKDIFLCSLDRIYNFKNFHIVQEMEVRDGVAIAEAESAVLRTKTVNEEGFADADVPENRRLVT